MRTAYHHQLDALKRGIGDLCGLSGAAMQRATQALLEADIGVAEAVISQHESFLAAVGQAETDAFNLLALQAPVATELRAVFANLQNVADADRMGALALHVAQIARRRHPAHAIPDDVTGYFAEMGRIAVRTGGEIRDIVLSSDPDRAATLADKDDAMDDLHRRLFSVVMDPEWRHGVAAAVDVTLLGRYYERFADHAVQIGRRVIFQATGTPAA
ncbi:phosphate signaling complex protein PhoU [Mycobacterium sherrisii]|uniref:Phosphate transport system regulatory protein PhoU n=1 Tax=Mycobacterium sherrisii TaxID=243061 RepID=A0A1E3SQY5_9MYCO|nr:phosphate signaling complex protein PhoU [Mycobacterium sherrisii]MCV7032616.1 phosphate signaling complex protein PhoU [Mycobacterium sherrisii]MEC4765245.1 phosphate signaling complex protein PhoU [Mycobacterium sherrisii]ODR04519.1 phosphate transport system regulatory protein PhoU [Mycobacterium sherrisii]ORW79557.1 PhoU family transcriptional regulator [Mycobacterium sherrisii]